MFHSRLPPVAVLEMTMLTFCLALPLLDPLEMSYRPLFGLRQSKGSREGAGTRVVWD